MAKPQFRRFPVTVGGKLDFCIAVYIPYVGRLVETNKGAAWIRYGDSRHEMSDEEKRDFRSATHERGFEVDNAACTYPDDFDMEIIGDLCSRSRQAELRSDWSDEEILIDAHLGAKRDGDFVPFNNLMLIAGKDPRGCIPGCRIRVQRFLGTEEGSGLTYNPVVDQWADGNIVQLVAKAEALIEKTLFDVRWFGADGKFEFRKEYPRSAWFEALVNACVHRSYSYSGSEITIKFFIDRMVIESPGGFFPPVSEKTIYESRSSRNYHLMEGLRRLGYVQMAREGTRRIKASMTEWGLPDPLFRQEALHGVVVRVTLLNDNIVKKNLAQAAVLTLIGSEQYRKLAPFEVDILAYALIRENSRGVIRVSEAERVTGRTWRSSRRDLQRLVNRGILEHVPGTYKSDPSAHYRLKEIPSDAANE